MMSGKVIVWTIVITIGGLSSAISWAGPEKRFDEGTKMCRSITLSNLFDGYKAFRTLCKGCHKRDNDVGAKFLETESKTNKAWNRVFWQKYPACAKNGSWDSLTFDERLKLNDYLFYKAWGHDDPNDASCA